MLADGPSTDRGELALGRTSSSHSCRGATLQDAIILSERLVKDDVLTSIHIPSMRSMPANQARPEEIRVTSDLSTTSSPTSMTVELSASVPRWPILVGVTKGETDHPEERLLRAIFGEAREVRIPASRFRTVSLERSSTSRCQTAMTATTAPGVNNSFTLYVAQTRKISVGDKLAGRHGNKVISKVLPVEDAVPRRRFTRRHHPQPTRCSKANERWPGA